MNELPWNLSRHVIRATPLFYLCALVLGLAGCQQGDVDKTKNIFPPSADAISQQGETVEGGESCATCPSVGDWYRFNTLAVLELDNEVNPVTDLLNPLWELDIKLYELNIIFQVVETSADLVLFRAGNAARVGTEGEMCMMTATEISVSMARENCHLKSVGTSAINIYAGTQTNPKVCSPNAPLHAIAVQGVELEADFTEDCGQVIDGEILRAYLPKAALDDTCSCITTGSALSDEACITPDPAYEHKDCGGCNDGFVALNIYLEAFSPGGALKYLCTTDGGDPAVCLNGTFSMTRLDAAIPDCP